MTETINSLSFLTEHYIHSKFNRCVAIKQFEYRKEFIDHEKHVKVTEIKCTEIDDYQLFLNPLFCMYLKRIFSTIFA